MRLGYVIIYVPDVEAAIAFYEKAFGFQRRFMAAEADFGELSSGAVALGLVNGELSSGEVSLGFVNESVIGREGEHRFRPGRWENDPAGIKLALIVDDVKAAYDRAINAGATSYGAPLRKPWGQTVGYVRDLNGFVVELCSEWTRPDASGFTSA